MSALQVAGSFDCETNAPSTRWFRTIDRSILDHWSVSGTIGQAKSPDPEVSIRSPMNTCLGASKSSRIHDQPLPRRRASTTLMHCTGGRSTSVLIGTLRRIETPGHVGLVPRGPCLIAAACSRRSAAHRALSARVVASRQYRRCPEGPAHWHGSRSSVARPAARCSTESSALSRWALATASGLTSDAA